MQSTYRRCHSCTQGGVYVDWGFEEHRIEGYRCRGSLKVSPVPPEVYEAWERGQALKQRLQEALGLEDGEIGDLMYSSTRGILVVADSPRIAHLEHYVKSKGGTLQVVMQLGDKQIDLLS